MKYVRRFALIAHSFSLAQAATMAVDTHITLLDDENYCYASDFRYNLGTLFHDLGSFARNLFTPEAFLVLTPFVPPYGLTRSFVDERVQDKFYCGRHHHNLRQSSTLYELSEVLVGLSIGSLVSCSLAVNNRKMQRTSQMYAITLPVLWATKSLLKKIPWSCNYRPKREGFSRHKRSYGGFPSGHIFEMTYATVLFGLRMGPGLAVPLAASTAVVGTSFVMCNRHYVSQLVGGAALGTMFACAAYWALESMEHCSPFALRIRPDIEHKQLALCAEYKF